MGQTPDTNDTAPTKNTTVPFALETAAAWSWRLLVVAGAGWVLWQGLAKVSLLVISLMVAALLAALLSPAVYALRKRGVRAGAATAIAEIGMSTLQSRALAGMANRTAVFCMSGSTGACKTAWEHVLKDQLDSRTRPCNFYPHLTRSEETS